MQPTLQGLWWKNQSWRSLGAIFDSFLIFILKGKLIQMAFRSINQFCSFLTPGVGRDTKLSALSAISSPSLWISCELNSATGGGSLHRGWGSTSSCQSSPAGTILRQVGFSSGSQEQHESFFLLFFSNLEIRHLWRLSPVKPQNLPLLLTSLLVQAFDF